MEDKIKFFKEVCQICHKFQKEGKKIVFVHGFFDILHAGHINFFVNAKKIGDFLVVGVDSDINAKLLKGKDRPINNIKARLYVLKNIVPIDYLFCFDSMKRNQDLNKFYELYYKMLRPDIIVVRSSVDKYAEIKKHRAKLIGAEFTNLPPYRTSLTTTQISKVIVNRLI